MNIAAHLTELISLAEAEKAKAGAVYTATAAFLDARIAKLKQAEALVTKEIQAVVDALGLEFKG